MIVNPLMAGYSISLHATEAAAGLTGGIMYLGSLFTRPAAGHLADRISKYRLTMAGLLIMAVSFAGYLISGNVYLLDVWRVMSGIGYSICSIAITTWIAQLFDRDHVGQGMGFYGMINAVAMATAPMIASVLEKAGGFRLAFSFAILFLIFSFILIQFVRNRGKSLQTQKEADQEMDRHPIVLRSVVPIALIIMLFTIPFFATSSFIYEYMNIRNPGLNAALFFPFYAGFLLILRMSLKNQFDKKPFGLFLWFSLISSVLCCICLTWPLNLAVLILSGFFMAGGYGIMCSECQSTAILLAKPEESGLANSTYYIGIDCGLMLGPVIGGQLMEFLPIDWFYPCLVLTALGIALVYSLNRKKLSKVH